MSGYNFGLTPHQQALELLAAFADPVKTAEQIKRLKDTTDEQVKELQAATAEHDQKLAALQTKQAEVDASLAASQKNAAEAQSLRDEATAKRDEIARRQDSWEANLNAREADLKRREDEHAAWWARQQDEASTKTAALVNRSVELDAREKALAESQSAVDAMKAELDAKLAKIRAINA